MKIITLRNSTKHIQKMKTVNFYTQEERPLIDGETILYIGTQQSFFTYDTLELGTVELAYNEYNADGDLTGTSYCYNKGEEVDLSPDENGNYLKLVANINRDTHCEDLGYEVLYVPQEEFFNKLLGEVKEDETQ